MATVVGLFDDLDGLYKAVDALEKEGLGDDITEVYDGSKGGDTDQEVGDEDLLGGEQAIGAGAVASQGGAAQPLAVNLQGALSRLDSLGEEGDFFRNSAQHDGKLVILETDAVDKAVEILRETGAERVHDPRQT